MRLRRQRVPPQLHIFLLSLRVLLAQLSTLLPQLPALPLQLPGALIGNVGAEHALCRRHTAAAARCAERDGGDASRDGVDHEQQQKHDVCSPHRFGAGAACAWPGRTRARQGREVVDRVVEDAALREQPSLANLSALLMKLLPTST